MESVWKVLRLVRAVWPLMSLAALCGVLTVGSNIGLLATSAFLICSAALHPSVVELSVAIVGVRFFGLARAVFRYAERYVAHDATFRVLRSVRVWFYQTIEPLAPARLQRQSSSDLFSAIVGDVESLRDLYLRAVAPPVVAVIVMLGMVVWLAQFAVIFSYVIVIAFVIAGVLVPLLVRSLNQKHGRLLVQAKADLNRELADSIAGMTELTAFGVQAQQADRIHQANNRLVGLQLRIAGVSGLHDAFGSFFMHYTVLVILLLGIPLVTAGRLDGIYLAVVALAVLSSFEAVLPLPLALQHFSLSVAAAQRLFRIAGQHPVDNPGTAVPCAGDLLLRDVSFRYPQSRQPSVQGIYLQLTAGQKIAVVGLSGAGKSTLVQLLLQFWEYNSGEILLNGQLIRAYDLEKYRALFAVVSQQTHLFNASILDNILLARPAATPDEVAKAVQAAALQDFITQLPQGINTLVGQNGQALSGGQRQRIAIARAMLKDAPFLILDEPTNGLDAVTETEVMSAVDTLMAGRTTLLVTHRLTGLAAMDEIIVLERGQIIERGTQQQLEGQQGQFYRMRQLQLDVLP